MSAELLREDAPTDIWDYSLERFGFETAEAYLRDVQRAVATIAEDLRRLVTTSAQAIVSSPSVARSVLPGV